MDAGALQAALTREGMTLQAALNVVNLRTGAILSAKNISKSIQQQGKLSAPLSAMFGLLFLNIEQARRIEHETKLQDFAAARQAALIAEINQLKRKK